MSRKISHAHQTNLDKLALIMYPETTYSMATHLRNKELKSNSFYQLYAPTPSKSTLHARYSTLASKYRKKSNSFLVVLPVLSLLWFHSLKINKAALISKKDSVLSSSNTITMLISSAVLERFRNYRWALRTADERPSSKNECLSALRSHTSYSSRNITGAHRQQSRLFF